MSTQINITVEGKNLVDLSWEYRQQQRQQEEQRREKGKQEQKQKIKKAQEKEQEKAKRSAPPSERPKEEPAANTRQTGILLKPQTGNYVPVPEGILPGALQLQRMFPYTNAYYKELGKVFSYAASNNGSFADGVQDYPIFDPDAAGPGKNSLRFTNDPNSRSYTYAFAVKDRQINSKGPATMEVWVKFPETVAPVDGTYIDYTVALELRKESDAGYHNPQLWLSLGGNQINVNYIYGPETQHEWNYSFLALNNYPNFNDEYGFTGASSIYLERLVDTNEPPEGTYSKALQGQWAHVCVQMHESAAYAYLNGQLIASIISSESSSLVTRHVDFINGMGTEVQALPRFNTDPKSSNWWYMVKLGNFAPDVATANLSIRGMRYTPKLLYPVMGGFTPQQY